MKQLRWFLSLAAVGLLGAGCYPTHVISSPGAFGFVADRQTRAPVAGAQVVVSRAWQREWPNYGPPTVVEALDKTRPPSVTTTTNGHFVIPAERKWIMQFPPPEGGNRGSLIIQHEGYQPEILPLIQNGEQDVGRVLLTPLFPR
jgi:hypothetical protein